MQHTPVPAAPTHSVPQRGLGKTHPLFYATAGRAGVAPPRSGRAPHQSNAPAAWLSCRACGSGTEGGAGGSGGLGWAGHTRGGGWRGRGRLHNEKTAPCMVRIKVDVGCKYRVSLELPARRRLARAAQLP